MNSGAWPWRNLQFATVAAWLLPAIAWLWLADFARAAIHGTVLFPSITNLTPNLSNPIGVAVADIDGDGWTDIVGSGTITERIVWYRNNGNGTFASTQYVVTTSPASAAFSNVAVADLNVDGRPDVIYWSGTSVKWSPNLGGSNPVTQFGYNSGNVTANQFPVGTTASIDTFVSAADLNGDTRMDVLSRTGNPDRSVAWVPNLTSGFGSRIVVSAAGNDPSSLQGVDIDLDGARDLLVTSVADNSVAWFQNLGAGTFGPRQVLANSSAVAPFARFAAMGDLNGDGRPDVVFVGAPPLSSTTTTIRWFAQNAVGVSPRFSTTVNTAAQFSAGIYGSYMLALKDIDSDGWLDIVFLVSAPFTTTTPDGRVAYCINQRNGTFGTPVTVGPLGFPLGLEVVDLDQNGVLDVVANANSQAKISYFRNFGGQTAITTTNTAPTTLVEGRRDDALKLEVSNRGTAGDSAAKLDTLSLRFEGSSGVLNTAQANALIDKVAVHRDADGSGIFDPTIDPVVATVTQLTLTNGVQSFPFTGSTAADIEVAAGATRTYFVVLKIAEFGAAQTPNTVRVTHISHGSGRSIMRDADSNAALTIESATIVNSPSGYITAQPAHTYTDYAHLYFDSATATGTTGAEDYDSDGNSNLAEFGFGMDPTTAGSTNIAVSGATLVRRGLPTAQATNTVTGVTYEAIFGRRKDTLAGLTYSVQFSANLLTWVTSTATPTVLADDGVIEAVSVPYPFFVNGKKARFFRVQVASP